LIKWGNYHHYHHQTPPGTHPGTLWGIKKGVQDRHLGSGMEGLTLEFLSIILLFSFLQPSPLLLLLLLPLQSLLLCLLKCRVALRELCALHAVLRQQLY
jgi:hypothetical protein